MKSRLISKLLVVSILLTACTPTSTPTAVLPTTMNTPTITPRPTPPVTSAEDLLDRTASIEVIEIRWPYPYPPPIFTITDRELIKEMIFLLLQAEASTSLKGERHTHILNFYEEGGKEKAAVAWTATPPILRALGVLPPGHTFSLHYNYPLNRFMSEHQPLSGNFTAPPFFKELFAAEHEWRGLEVWCPRPTSTPAK